MAQAAVIEFVKAALHAGASRREVEEVLLRAGWSRDQVSDALGAFADVEFVVPVPRPRAQVSARDTFVYLVAFGALYVAVFALGNLLFQFVNLAFPDPLLDGRAGIDGRIRWAIANLVVAYPLFLYVSYRIHRALSAEPARRSSPVRRWLIFVTLTVAVFVIVGDVIALVYSFLSGELTVRFGLKALIVAGLAGGVFGYYRTVVRADDRELSP